MDFKILLQGRSIRFDREDVVIEANEFRLLADVDAPVVIHEGEHRRIATPITISGGNGSVVAMAFVAAGQPGETIDPGHGQFVVSPDEGERTIEVDVVNRTGAILTIPPRAAIGTLLIRQLRTEDDEADDVPADAATTADELHVRAIYRPRHAAADIKPAYGSSGAAAFDLRADVAGTTVLNPGQREAIATGLSMAIPQGHEGQIRPRSGLALKHGISITNSPATIDADYRGEIKVVLHNLGDEPFRIEPGDRIAQMLVAPVSRVVLEYVDSLDDTDRGAGGFGSTGRS